MKQNFKSKHSKNASQRKIKTLENMSNLYSLQRNEHSDEDYQFIKNLNLITIKPMLYICNIDEKSVQELSEYSKRNWVVGNIIKQHQKNTGALN